MSIIIPLVWCMWKMFSANILKMFFRKTFSLRKGSYRYVNSEHALENEMYSIFSWTLVCQCVIVMLCNEHVCRMCQTLPLTEAFHKRIMRHKRITVENKSTQNDDDAGSVWKLEMNTKDLSSVSLGCLKKVQFLPDKS